MSRFTILLVAFLALLLVASSVQAGTVKTRFDTLTGDGSMQTNIKNGGGGAFEFALLSENGDGTDLPFPVGSSFIGFCIELVETINYGAVKDYDVVPPATAPKLNGTYGAMGPYAADDMAILFGNHHQGNAKSDWTATQGAAFQLAVWEIVYENTQAAGTNFNGTYNVTSTNPLHGNFYVTGGVSTTVLNLANSYLATVNAGTGPTASLLALSRPSGPITGNGQDYLVVVPLPMGATVGLGLLGLLGLIAAHRGRRRRR